MPSLLSAAMLAELGGFRPRTNFQIQVLSSLFFRNKGAFLLYGLGRNLAHNAYQALVAERFSDRQRGRARPVRGEVRGARRAAAGSPTRPALSSSPSGRRSRPHSRRPEHRGR